MYDDIEKILITKAEIEEKVRALAAQLDADYRDKNPLMLCILKGSVLFFSDIVRNMKIKLEIDFMAISSYGAGTTSGIVRLVKDLDRSIEGRHVVIVEDIVDTGHTLAYLKRVLNQRRPASVKICTLLDKFERREAEVDVDYKAFDIGNEFVDGYGLDYAETYRNLPEIGILKRSVYEK